MPSAGGPCIGALLTGPSRFRWEAKQKEEEKKQRQREDE
jgi:hypothetical protein